MRSRTRVNLMLTALVLALAAIAVLRPGGDAPPQLVPLVAGDVPAPARIRMTRPDQPPMLLEREGDVWRLRAPHPGPANPARVQMLLRVLEARGPEPLSAREHDPARFGLAPPRAVLEIDALRIEYGDDHPLDGRRYLRLGDAIHLLGDVTYHLLVSDAAAFVDPALVGSDRALDAIRLPGRTLVRADGAWSVARGEPLAAPRLEAVVSAWRHARAVRVTAFAGEVQASIGLDFADGTTREYAIVEDAGGVRLIDRERGVAFHIAPPEADTLLARAPAAPIPRS